MDAQGAGAMAAARARERALAAHRKDEDYDDEEEEASTLISEETNPMLDEDGNKVTFPGCKRIALNEFFNSFITFVVVIAGIMVGVQTEKEMQTNPVIKLVDTAILGIFILESVIKILAEAPKPWRYFNDPWNTMDFTIAFVGLIDWSLTIAGMGMEGGAGSAIMVFRLFRLMRIMKLIKTIPQLRIIVSTLIAALPSVMYISILIFLMLYIYAVLGVFIFGGNDKKYFGNLGKGMITLFRVMTLDHWGEIMYVQLYGCVKEYTVLDKQRFGCTPSKTSSGLLVIVFFLSYIMLVSFIVLNLFVGVVTSSLNQATKEVRSDPDTLTGEDEYEEPTNTQIETLVTSLQGELQDCRQEMGDIRDKLAMILQDQNQ